MTHAERKVWYALRAHRLGGASFRRQTPVGPYLVDFLCHQHRLVVEVDGGHHVEGPQRDHDLRREAFLRSKGHRVLRFSNLDVPTNLLGVLETIVTSLGHAPSLPSPANGGGGERGGLCGS
ncbi:endonuclease domain-containing protein [Rhodoplanes sp. TEM]|uniref:Endonuclease domain-containing protein n=2 Tax=Rhodoplanes tepidamans TaxID=200616 RepID=A0ABT5JH44_RHOTP|nr:MULTISPECIES: endonuclease domain-containing protein [Rhodoplanes]MDC7788614.1 endonuclease domain-containing protein [Rhodoplanes tepidamans]MDC7982473.1 endonuclease domain-containing protein [Rhodoplanes sp. TEM]